MLSVVSPLRKNQIIQDFRSQRSSMESPQLLSAIDSVHRTMSQEDKSKKDTSSPRSSNNTHATSSPTSSSTFDNSISSLVAAIDPFEEEQKRILPIKEQNTSNIDKEDERTATAHLLATICHQEFANGWSWSFSTPKQPNSPPSASNEITMNAGQSKVETEKDDPHPRLRSQTRSSSVENMDTDANDNAKRALRPRRMNSKMDSETASRDSDLSRSLTPSPEAHSTITSFGGLFASPSVIEEDEINEEDYFDEYDSVSDNDNDTFTGKEPSTKPRSRRIPVCTIKGCPLCLSGRPSFLDENSGWREILVAIFQAAYEIDPSIEGKWIFLPNLYEFVESHWHILCSARKSSPSIGVDENWRKKLQDTLSHNKKYFSSGKGKFGKTGYWRLRELPPNIKNYYMQKKIEESAKFNENSRKRSHEDIVTTSIAQMIEQVTSDSSKRQNTATIDPSTVMELIDQIKQLKATVEDMKVSHAQSMAALTERVATLEKSQQQNNN